jgi:hypothetical protein
MLEASCHVETPREKWFNKRLFHIIASRGMVIFLVLFDHRHEKKGTRAFFIDF